MDVIMTNKSSTSKEIYIDSELGTDRRNDLESASDNMSRPKFQPVSIVIPAFNEEESISYQIEALKRVADSHGIEYELIVVDDGSEDNTADKATDNGVRVLHHPENRGYGAALKTGIGASKYDTIVILDADGTYPAEAIPKLLEKADEYDMVVGARIDGNVHIPFARKPAKWFLTKLAVYLAGQSIPDLNSGLRVMKKSVIERFYSILPSGFSFTTTITLAFITNDYPIYYYPIEYRPRIGRSKIRPVDAYHFLLLILRTIVYFNPLKVFLPLGGMLFLMGLVKFVYDLFLGNLSESAVLGFLGAFIIWAIGLLSDQISRIGFGSRLSG
jgi:glycosyltransferase involved in cell wall biosynthesis